MKNNYLNETTVPPQIFFTTFFQAETLFGLYVPADTEDDANTIANEILSAFPLSEPFEILGSEAVDLAYINQRRTATHEISQLLGQLRSLKTTEKASNLTGLISRTNDCLHSELPSDPHRAFHRVGAFIPDRRPSVPP